MNNRSQTEVCATETGGYVRTADPTIVGWPQQCEYYSTVSFSYFCVLCTTACPTLVASLTRSPLFKLCHVTMHWIVCLDATCCSLHMGHNNCFHSCTIQLGPQCSSWVVYNHQWNCVPLHVPQGTLTVLNIYFVPFSLSTCRGMPLYRYTDCNIGIYILWYNCIVAATSIYREVVAPSE